MLMKLGSLILVMIITVMAFILNPPKTPLEGVIRLLAAGVCVVILMAFFEIEKVIN